MIRFVRSRHSAWLGACYCHMTRRKLNQLMPEETPATCDLTPNNSALDCLHALGMKRGPELAKCLQNMRD